MHKCFQACSDAGGNLTRDVPALGRREEQAHQLVCILTLCHRGFQILLGEVRVRV